MALHDAVLIRIGGNDEATRQACARIDKLVDKYRAENPDIKPAQPSKPWVELTPAEVHDIWCCNHTPQEICDAVSAKLRKKNAPNGIIGEQK